MILWMFYVHIHVLSHYKIIPEKKKKTNLTFQRMAKQIFKKIPFWLQLHAYTHASRNAFLRKKCKERKKWQQQQKILVILIITSIKFICTAFFLCRLLMMMRLLLLLLLLRNCCLIHEVCEKWKRSDEKLMRVYSFALCHSSSFIYLNVCCALVAEK